MNDSISDLLKIWQENPHPKFVDELELALRRRHAELNQRRRVWQVAAIFMMVAFVTMLLLPAGRSFAQGIFDDLFQQAESDTRSPNERSATSTEFQEREWQSFESVSEAESMLAIDIRAPEKAPNGFGLQEVSALADKTYVVLFYQSRGRVLLITQRTEPMGENDGLIGNSANMVAVTVNGFAGAYVEGEWISTDAGEKFQWLNDVSARRLRWIEAGTLYEIVSMGGSVGHSGYLGMKDLIALAESLK